MSERCAVCRTQPGPVCPDDLHAVDEDLAKLPRRLNAVAAALQPGQSRLGERGSKRVHAGLPVQIDAMSITGPGSEIPVQLHPLVRHWSVRHKMSATVFRDGQWRAVTVTVTDWFHEAVLDTDGRPVMPPDDQVGSVPPREWLDMQARRLRAHFGHHVPARTLLGRQQAYVPPAYRTLLRVPGGTSVVAFLAACAAAGGAHARMKYLGLLSYQDPAEQPGDPYAALERRAGPHGVQWDIDYLRTWLPKAIAEDALDIAAFVTQLRGMHAEISRALGEVPDQEWVGRCPAFLTELDPDGEPTGRKKPCGGGLWQDNTAFSAQVQCPRCHSTWDTRGHAGAGTAREIRRVWPVDRRRRYTADEIDRLRTPTCPACTKRVKIVWREVTGTRDPLRTWQPMSATCPNGCDEARRTV